MIGLLGAKIWKENGVDFGNPVNLVPVAAGIIIAIGDTTLVITDNFQISGIAFGTIVTVVAFHLARLIAPPYLQEQLRRSAPDDPRRAARARPSSSTSPAPTRSPETGHDGVAERRPRPGDRAELSRRVEAADIRRFTDISGDRNPLHYDEAAARASRFGRSSSRAG